MKKILEMISATSYIVRLSELIFLSKWLGGGIGRRAGFKIQYLHGCASSILARATIIFLFLKFLFPERYLQFQILNPAPQLIDPFPNPIHGLSEILIKQKQCHFLRANV